MAEVDFGKMVGDMLDVPASREPDVQIPGNTPPPPEIPPQEPVRRGQQPPYVQPKIEQIRMSDARAQAEQRMAAILDGRGSDEASQKTPDAAAEAVETPAAEEESLVPGDVLPEPEAEVVQPPPPAPPEQEEQEPPELADNPKARNAWTKSKQERKQLKSEIETLKAQLEEARKTPPVAPAEIEELRKAAAEKAQLEERLGKLDISQSVEFRKQYDLPINTVYQKTLAALIQAGKRPDDAKALIGKIIKPGNDASTIQDLVMDEAPMLQGVLYQNGLEMIELQKRRAGAVQNWKATKSQLREEEQRSAQAALQTQMEGAVSTAIDTLRTEGSWAFKVSATNQKWNAEVEQRVEVAKGILKSAPPEVLAKYVADGVAAKAYREYGVALAAQNRKLRAELTMLTGSRPGLSSRRPDTPPPPKKLVGPVKPETYLDGLFQQR